MKLTHQVRQLLALTCMYVGAKLFQASSYVAPPPVVEPEPEEDDEPDGMVEVPVTLSPAAEAMRVQPQQAATPKPPRAKPLRGSIQDRIERAERGEE